MTDTTPANTASTQQPPSTQASYEQVHEQHFFNTAVEDARSFGVKAANSEELKKEIDKFKQEAIAGGPIDPFHDGPPHSKAFALRDPEGNLTRATRIYVSIHGNDVEIKDTTIDLNPDGSVGFASQEATRYHRDSAQDTNISERWRYKEVFFDHNGDHVMEESLVEITEDFASGRKTLQTNMDVGGDSTRETQWTSQIFDKNDDGIDDAWQKK